MTAGSTTTQSKEQIRATIDAEARRLGVDPALAEAMAEQESGLDPNAVGDNGTSFGLYQLHKGGELGSMSKTQAFDPVTNIDTALGEVVRVMKTHPGVDPGQIAALAQRPADPAKYAQAIDARMTAAGHALIAAPTGSANAAEHGLSSATGTNVTPAEPTGAGHISTPLGTFDVPILDTLGSSSFWIRMAFIVGGFMVILIAVGKLASDAGGSVASRVANNPSIRLGAEGAAA